MSRQFAICPFCGCGCGLYLQAVGGGTFAATPSQTSPAGAGRLCLRGWQAGGLLHSARRFLLPRVGSEDTPWDGATREAAAGLGGVLRGGPEALGMLCSGRLTNEEAFACRKYAAEVANTPNVDNSARALERGSLWGLEQTFCVPYRTPVLPEILASDVVLCLSSNLCSDHAQAAGYMAQAAEAGAAVVVLDEVDQGFRELASLYIAHRPGVRAAVLNAILRSLAGYGHPGTENSERLDPTGVPAEAFRELCSLLRHARHLSIIFSTTTVHIPAETARVAEIAMLLSASKTAQVAVFALRSQCNSVGVADMGLVPASSGGQRGLTLFEMLAQDSPVRGLVVCDEALEEYIGERELRELRKRLDFLLCIGCYETLTSELADVALPMAGWGEVEGTFTTADSCIWPVRQVAGPAGDSRALGLVLAPEKGQYRCVYI